MKNEPIYTLVFGLTADPIHKGHEQVILNSFEFTQAHKINIESFILLPTYQPNLVSKKKQPETAFEHRYKMCELVASGLRNQCKYPIYVSDIEKQLYLKTGQKSFSYESLNALNKKQILFILSADHFSGRWPVFRKWHQWQALVKKNGLLIHQRPKHNINSSFIEQLKEINPAVYVVKGLNNIDVSSTMLRNMFKKKGDIPASYISQNIYQYCLQNKLYEIQT